METYDWFSGVSSRFIWLAFTGLYMCYCNWIIIFWSYDDGGDLANFFMETFN